MVDHLLKKEVMPYAKRKSNSYRFVLRHLIGGFALAARWCGIKTVAFCEIDKFCQQVLRKNFGKDIFIHDDIKTFHWGVDKNDGKCYKELCEQKNKNLPMPETFSLQSPQQESLKFSDNVRTVEKKQQFAHVKQQRAQVSSAQTNAGMNLNEETMEQTQVAGSGCVAKVIQNTKTEQDTKEANDTTKRSVLNGEDVSMPEINILAKNADLCRGNQTLSTPTISNIGKITQKEDSMLGMGLPSAKPATERNTNEQVFLLTGGFPCQSFSCAGKRKGIKDDRYLWPEMFRVIQEVHPRWIIAENVPGLISIDNGLVFERVCLDLENQGYEVQTFIIPACAVGACHRRDRVWIIGRSNAADTQSKQTQPAEPGGFHAEFSGKDRWDEPWIEAASRFCGVSYGLPDRLVRYSLTMPVTNGIIGFILMLRRYHYAASEETRAREVLPILREAFAEESLQRCFGRLSEVFKTEDLRCPVHGKVDGAREGSEEILRDTGKKVKEEELRGVQYDNQSGHTPQERGLGGQCSCEFDDIVRELSHEIALGEWKNNAEKAENILFNLWKESRGERFLHEPLPALYEIWRSVTDKEVGSFRRHLDKRNRNRVQKLKALGNSIVPQVAYQIMKAILKVEEAH